MSTSPIPAQDLSFLWLEITAKCNLECQHCYADSSPGRQLFGEMATRDWLQILLEAASLGCTQVQFIGGEPTLHPDLVEMISFASDKGFSFIEVFTNATHINEELIKAFAKYRVRVAISFYSDVPATHDSITKRHGSFERTVRNIKRMVEEKIPIRAGIIETRLNSGHSPSAKYFLEQLGISDIKVDFERGIGRGHHQDPSGNPMAELCGECWKGKLCVTPSGRAYPCVFSRFADLGSVKGGVSNLIGSDSLSQFRAVLRNYKLRQPCDPICSPCAPETFRACSPDTRCNPANADCMPKASVPDCSPTCMPSRF